MILMHSMFWYIIILLITVILFLFFKKTVFEGFNKKYALCLLTVKPNNIHLEFFNKFDKYDVYVFVDNNSININDFEIKYPNIHFIQFPDEKVIEEGYWESSYVIPKKTISWDKALYYFSKINTSYIYVWFIEDDVYIPKQESLILLDKYLNDLICNKFISNFDGKEGWHWGQAEPYFELPWAGGLQCICRLSNRLLNKIKEFVYKHKKLTFIEVLFATLVIQNNYSYICPDEFVEIDCCKTHKISNLDPNILYHPIKNIEDHKILRQKIT